jgi:hypothetical protein
MAVVFSIQCWYLELKNNSLLYYEKNHSDEVAHLVDLVSANIFIIFYKCRENSKEWNLKGLLLTVTVPPSSTQLRSGTELLIMSIAKNISEGLRRQTRRYPKQRETVVKTRKHCYNSENNWDVREGLSFVLLIVLKTLLN